MKDYKAFIPYFILGNLYEQLGIYFWIVLGILFVIRFMDSGVIQILIKEFGKTLRCYIKQDNVKKGRYEKKRKKNHKSRQ